MDCACAKWPYFPFRSQIWRHHRVPRPRFPTGPENFGDSLTFKADIEYLIFAWIFEICWPKRVFLGGKIGELVVRYWPLTNSFFLLGVLTSVPILVKIDQELRPWECSQTDRYTDWQTQTDFIICPMLYAIAMGQINKEIPHNELLWCFWWQIQRLSWRHHHHRHQQDEWLRQSTTSASSTSSNWLKLDMTINNTML